MKQKQPFFFLFCGIILSLFTLLVVLVNNKQHRGFSIEKIRSPFEFNPNWAIETLSETEKSDLREILLQDFKYLGSGAQSYAFISADGKYVIKFFKIKYLLPKKWLKWIPFSGLEHYKMKKIDKRILRHKQLFSSYKMAYEQLQEETGLVYIHLNKTRELNIRIKIYDKINHCYHVKLDDFEYIVQKKAQLVRDRIIDLMQCGKREEALEAIQALLQHVVHQCQKGFIDQDSGVNHNYGFLDKKVIHFDVGELIYDENAKQPSYYHREVLRVGRKIEEWLKFQYPTLLHDVEESINAMINPSEENYAKLSTLFSFH